MITSHSYLHAVPAHSFSHSLSPDMWNWFSIPTSESMRRGTHLMVIERERRIFTHTRAFNIRHTIMFSLSRLTQILCSAIKMAIINQPQLLMIHKHFELKGKCLKQKRERANDENVLVVCSAPPKDELFMRVCMCVVVRWQKGYNFSQNALNAFCFCCHRCCCLWYEITLPYTARIYYVPLLLLLFFCVHSHPSLQDVFSHDTQLSWRMDISLWIFGHSENALSISLCANFLTPTTS